MYLKDIVSEAPDNNMVPMGGGGAPDLKGKKPYVAGNPADDADKSAIPQDPQDQSQQVDAQEITRFRPAIKILMPEKDESSINFLIQGLKRLMRGQSVSVAREIEELKDFVTQSSLAVVKAAGVGGAKRADTLKKSIVRGKQPSPESIQEEITGQDRIAIKQIVPDNEKVNDIIRAMDKIQKGSPPPTDTIPAINDLIQNSIGIQIQLGTAQTKRGQDMVKQQQRAGGLDKQQSKDVPGMDQEKLAAGYENPADALDEGLGYAMPGQDEESERVTYSKTKKQGDSSVTVSANADSMDELHDILRLAGIDFEKSGEVDHTPDHKDHDDHEEPESDHGEHGKDKVMVISPADASMSTDKEVLTNYLKDKLRKSIS